MRRNIYTKPELAARIVAHLDLSPGMQIADLGCGEGVFLEALLDRLVELKCLWPQDGLTTSVTGIDVDESAAARARARLLDRHGSRADLWDVRCADALALNEAERFDAITGNPPWARLQHMDAATRELARARFAVARGAFDLYHLFIEKSVRLLRPGGQLAIVVPQALRFGPASAPARGLLSSEGVWSLSPLSADDFAPRALIRPALLSFRKLGASSPQTSAEGQDAPVIGSVATVTTGVPTGSDSVFIVSEDTVRRWELEEHRLREVVRGRDIREASMGESGSRLKLIWPYSYDESDRWRLDDLSDAPNTLRYLEAHRPQLSSRPRLAEFIRRNPTQWYRFIDPNRHRPHGRLRIVLPDVFRGFAFRMTDSPDVVVHNTCFQIVPNAGAEGALLDALQNPRFWETLRSNSRLLDKKYCRTSATELKATPLNY
ncbi:MAG: methyltransferase [Chloroflexi bacterium]|nr:methyltransferase [Chloroflexota bacterium]